MRHRNKYLIFLISALIICMTGEGFAQQGRGRGRIRGTVTDTSGIPLKDVKIVAEHLEYGTKFESKSKQKGNWSIGGLGTGPFRITAQLEGYTTVTQEIRVSQFSQKNPPVDIVLQKITVQEQSPSAIQDKGTIALLEEGNALFEEEQYTDALAKFREFMEKNPRVYQVQINIGNCYKEMGEYDKALAAFNTVLNKIKEEKGSLEGDEASARALSSIGETYIIKGDINNAMEYLQQAIDIFPEDEILTFNIGEIFFKRGEAAKGIEYFDRAIQIKSDWAPPYRQRGYAYLNLANYKMAIESFKKFLELAPDHPQAPIIENLIPKLEEMIKK